MVSNVRKTFFGTPVIEFSKHFIFRVKGNPISSYIWKYLRKQVKESDSKKECIKRLFQSHCMQVTYFYETEFEIWVV